MIDNYNELHKLTEMLFAKLFPICRSITGNGVRKSLKILQEYANFEIKEYPSGIQCYDWTIPKEWNIRDAWIKNKQGDFVVSFKENNLHVLNYSTPVYGLFTYDELLLHLYTLPEMPDAIPYRTTYYEEKWGFCLEYERFLQLNRYEVYEVMIDSTLEDGALTLVDALIKGSSDEEVLISTYCCHPSMGNDNLSGMILAILLYRFLSKRENRYSYRFVICPETIGVICYLKHHEEEMKKVSNCFVLTCVAGQGKIGFKETYLGNHELDRICKLVLEETGIRYKRYPFAPNGSDERQYSSIAFRIPTILITKDKYYDYKYYHTSKDNLEFVNTDNLLKTYEIYIKALCYLDDNIRIKSLKPECEARLGKRDLYPNTGGIITDANGEEASQLFKHKEVCRDETDLSLWILFLADGNHSILDIAEKTGAAFHLISKKIKVFESNGLLKIV